MHKENYRYVQNLSPELQRRFSCLFHLSVYSLYEDAVKNTSQESWSFGQDLNTGPPEYEAGAVHSTITSSRNQVTDAKTVLIWTLKEQCVTVCNELDSLQ
jgi:hypothetical protein